MDKIYKPELLTDKSRLQEIYDLRVMAYENSPKSIYVNKEIFPQGLFDHLDDRDQTFHWVVQDNNIIIAAARLAIIEDLKETILSGKCQEKDDYSTNHTVSATDLSDYWGDIDDRFMFATNNAERVYANGDNSIRTALTTEGFNRRKADGRRAAQDLVKKITNGTIKLLPGAVIDVVAHSMGYAYAQGMIEQLQTDGYKIGWVYAIAPENPTAGQVPNNIEGIWQYGSQETDPFNKQDGIAPQKPISGILQSQRVPIDPSAPQNFLQSHMIANYNWIFETRKGLKDKGHVFSR